jgi:hypothetical protein
VSVSGLPRAASPRSRALRLDRPTWWRRCSPRHRGRPARRSPRRSRRGCCRCSRCSRRDSGVGGDVFGSIRSANPDLAADRKITIADYSENPARDRADRSLASSCRISLVVNLHIYPRAVRTRASCQRASSQIFAPSSSWLTSGRITATPSMFSLGNATRVRALSIIRGKAVTLHAVSVPARRTPSVVNMEQRGIMRLVRKIVIGTTRPEGNNGRMPRRRRTDEPSGGAAHPVRPVTDRLHICGARDVVGG